MKILVTAFGPFEGRSENASSLALSALKRDLPSIHTRLFPVDAVIAPARLKQALKVLRPDLLLMLGEAAGSHAIRLERRAWNELDFRIPDVSGRQPVSRPILKTQIEMIASTLPLTEMIDTLKSGGHAVELSDDPGRYLCNQLFYVAMHAVKVQAHGCSAGFIHLPLAANYPTARAVDALKRIVQVAVACGAVR